MFRESSISQKLTWLNVMVSGAALIITAVALLIYDQSSYRRMLVENVSAHADVVAKNSVSAVIFSDPESATDTLSALESVPNVLAASLFTSDGKLFASYNRRPDVAITSGAELPDLTPREIFQNRQLLVTRSLRSGDKNVGYLVIRADASGIQARLLRYTLIVGIVLILSLLAAISLSTAFRRGVVRPITELAATARLVSAERNYSVRVPPSSSRDELAVLVDAFNEMLSGIQNRDVALERERARLGAILDNAPVGILVADPKTGETVLANQTVSKILHESDISGRPRSTWKLMRPNREVIEYEDRPLTRALRGETIVGEEYIVVRHDGSETWVRASAAPVREKQGEVAAGLLVVVAIDDQKKAQEALLQSEKLAAAGRLAASISHEINNPLESVTNLLFIALSHPSLSPEVHRLLAQADQELARVSHIATQTLRFYRQSTNPTSVDMGTLVDSVLQLLAGKVRNTSVHVERRYDSQQPITCFEGEMRQVFTNLISNSLDAAPTSGGRLVLRTKQVIASMNGEGGGIQITVADNGHGIPPALASRIFEPFYTTKGSRGTGLGLWVTKEIVEKHEGSIRVRSRSGVGTVFVIYIPYKGATERAQSARSAQLT